MTRDEYGSAYKRGYNLTVRFLVSRGLSYDAAQETAQAAWVKGWERLGQLRDSNMVLTWMNSIALNIHRSCMRREPFLQTLPELSDPAENQPRGHRRPAYIENLQKERSDGSAAALLGRLQGPGNCQCARLD